MIWTFYIAALILGAVFGPIGLGVAFGLCFLVALSRIHGAVTALGERPVIEGSREPLEVQMDKLDDGLWRS